MEDQTIYRVSFVGQGSVYEVYVKNVMQNDLFGFIELEGFLFGEANGVVVDPSEERLKKEFSGVERTYIPMHAILRIDEVQKRGTAKITTIPTDGSNISKFPGPIYTPTQAET